MEEKVNLDSIIKEISEKSDYSQHEVRSFCDIILEKFKRFLQNKDKIEIRGLGTFFSKEHKGRYVQLKTKIIDSKDHYAILFKESKKLSQTVNQAGEEEL
ncbi:MAG: HU family DNA-binding protein [Spirochaetes bacterium]|nr:HU family DNA-binding protein [Spirochaetota bacterium]